MPATCTSSASIITNAMRSIYLSNAATQSPKYCSPFRSMSPRCNTNPLRAPSRRSFTITSRNGQYVSMDSSEEVKDKSKAKSKSKSNVDDDFVLDIFPKEPKQKAKTTDKPHKRPAEGARIKTFKGKKPDGTEESPPTKKPKPELWQLQKAALQKKFKEGWNPPKKLSPDNMDMIRHLNSTKPEEWTTPALSEAFKVSPEAIRRILRSKWQPTEDGRKKRQERWERRHERIWAQMAELGLRKPMLSANKYGDLAALGMPKPEPEGPPRRRSQHLK